MVGSCISAGLARAITVCIRRHQATARLAPTLNGAAFTTVVCHTVRQNQKVRDRGALDCSADML